MDYGPSDLARLKVLLPSVALSAYAVLASSSERVLAVDLVKSSRMAALCFNYYKVSSISHPQDTPLFFFLIDTVSVDKIQTNINYQLLFCSYYCYCSYPRYYIAAT